MVTIWLSCSLDKTQVIFWNNLRNSEIRKKMKQSIIQGICRCSTTQLLSSANSFFSLGDRTSPSFFPVVCSKTGDARKSLPYLRSQRINVWPSKTITQVQFLTKYCNRQKGQPLTKHHRLNLDVDGLKYPRYPRMTKTATKRVCVFSLWCYQRQETLVNLALFQTTTN